MSRAAPPKPAMRTERMTSLHDVVLNYLQTHAYASTARTLVQGRPGGSGSGNGLSGGGAASNVIDGLASEDAEQAGASGGGDGMDVDGSAGVAEVDKTGRSGGMKGKDKVVEGVNLDEEVLVAIERRQAIINHILNGAIMRAVEALDTFFPSVLDDSAPMTSTNGSSNGHSTSPTTMSNLSRRASSAWHNPLSSNGSSTSNGHSNGSTTNGSGNGSSNGYSSSDHALPIMHRSLLPAHVKLNLSIQAFIESFRQLAPSSSPSTPSSSIGSLNGSMTMSIQMTGPGGMGGVGGKAGSSSSGVTLTNALTAAQGLHQEAKKLAPEDRAVYLQEIKDVGALLAYTDPETSILKGFLEQGRRIALADQVNRAILSSEGRQTTPRLEQYARRTTALYAIMAEKGIDAQPSWTAADGHGKEQLGAFWKGQSKSGFKLKDFVSHVWT